MSAALPRRLSDVPHDTPLGKLIEQYHDHVHHVLLVQPHIGHSVEARAMFDHAVAALTLAHAVAERLLAARWATIRDALAADASRGQDVADACGLDPDEVAVGLTAWADRQKHERLMPDMEYRVVVLLARGIRNGHGHHES